LLLSRRTRYHELGATYFETRRREQAKRRSLNQLWSYPVSVDGVGLAVRFSVC
jgi:hypothetical protein